MESPARSAINPIDATVGERVRQLRRHRELSLQQVAQRAELSVGFLSQIERGLSSPSLRDLIRVAAALEADLGMLFEGAGGTPPQGEGLVTRPAQRQEVAFHEGITKQLLTPHGDAALRLYLITIEPAGRTGEELYSHAGEEAGLVLQGRLLLTVETTDHLLQEGDSFRFRSDRPHRFSNASAMVTRVLWVNTAPVG
ncbi:helix-turn-helix domain-containing protein [Siccirubricoccus phaeus]|uniref:helix-turn-helix domain-containing protein n=1 Tax=Siccirubricoccus phaeus TaxID=2595053 RepID=UPI001A9C7EE3|nr:cupin domain-containing protein [Siccirubricoccus phaeus]